MFCDLVAWTERSQSLDAEAQLAQLHLFRSYASGLIAEMGGYVAQNLGDGILCYFGWPLAHEDSAERAVRVALELARGVPALRVSPPLAVHVGISTGLVVVGTEDTDAAGLAVGEAPNLAARLLSIAGAGQVVVAPSTRELLGDAFELLDLGEHMLKGIVHPVAVYGVVAPQRLGGRFDRRVGTGGIRPMFGRDREMQVLLDAWRSSRHGADNVVLISGVAGIGKSRLVHSLKEELARTSDRFLQLDCSAHRSGTALYPMIELLRRESEMAEGEDDALRLLKLRRIVEGRGQSEAAAGFLADLLSIPRGPIPPASLSGQKHKELTLEALAEYLTVRAQSVPLAVIVEDMHWADPTTIELIARVLSAVRSLPILIVLTFRPEFAPPWPRSERGSTIELGRLEPSAVAAIVREVRGNRELPAALEAEVASRTDGVPLYAEELTKAALSGASQRGQTVLPTTLQDSLLAQLDPLGEAKAVVQMGACFGRDFDFDVLTELAGYVEVRKALRAAVDARLLFAQGEAAHKRFVFGHSLIRDAAYESLPLSRRTTLHARIGSVLETTFPDRAAANPEIVAQHFTLGQSYERAVRYWIKAGERAIGRFEMSEARAHFERGMSLLTHVDEGRLRDELELYLQHGIGTAVGSSRGYTPPEVGEAFSRAYDLANAVGDFPERHSILFGLWLYCLMRADYERSAPLAADFLAMAEKSGEPERLLVAHSLFGVDRFFVGKLDETAAHNRRAWGLYRELQAPPLHRKYGMNSGPLAADFIAYNSQIMGFSDTSARYHDVAVEAAERTEDPVTLATVLAHAAVTACVRFDINATAAFSARCVEYSRKSGVFIREVEGEVFAGWVKTETGDLAGGLEILRAALAKWDSIGARITNTQLFGLFALALSRAGRGREAQEIAREATLAAERTGELLFLPDARRIEGDLLITHDGDEEGAEAHYDAAISTARQMGARWWELRATTRRSRVLHRRGRRDEAHDELKAVCEWFTEGAHLPDLMAARALLDEFERT